MKRFLILITCFISMGLNAQTVHFSEYFPLNDSTEKIYKVTRLQKKGPPLDYEDSHTWCFKQQVKGQDIYYFDDAPQDSTGKIIGSRIFLSGVCYYSHDTLYRSPVFWKYELDSATLHSFKPLYPPAVQLNKIYQTKDGDELRKYRFTGFENLTLNGRTYPRCLKMTILQIWPNKCYSDTVWFGKGIGVVKWIRSTGRVEELK